jgi:molybdopterin synthase catalytic subunit
MINFLLKEQGLTINGAIKLMNGTVKKLDDTKVSSIKAEYYKKEIKVKSKKILDRIKKING